MLVLHLLRLTMVVLLAGVGLVATGQAPASAANDPTTTLTRTAPVMQILLFKSTPIPEGYSNYCAVGTFVPFNEIKGYAPQKVDATFVGGPFSEPIGPAPYDDAATINGLVFTPVGAAHHTELGEPTYQQGGGDPTVARAECEKLRERSASFWATTATVTYEATGKCASSITKLIKANADVDKAKKKAKNTTGKAHTAAVAALNQAKDKARTAKQKYKKAC